MWTELTICLLICCSGVSVERLNIPRVQVSEQIYGGEIGLDVTLLVSVTVKCNWEEEQFLLNGCNGAFQMNMSHRACMYVCMYAKVYICNNSSRVSWIVQATTWTMQGLFRVGQFVPILLPDSIGKFTLFKCIVTIYSSIL